MKNLYFGINGQVFFKRKDGFIIAKGPFSPQIVLFVLPIIGIIFGQLTIQMIKQTNVYIFTINILLILFVILLTLGYLFNFKIFKCTSKVSIISFFLIKYSEYFITDLQNVSTKIVYKKHFDNKNFSRDIYEFRLFVNNVSEMILFETVVKTNSNILWDCMNESLIDTNIQLVKEF